MSKLVLPITDEKLAEKIEEYNREFTSYMKSHGWKTGTCSVCPNILFSKVREGPYCADHAGNEYTFMEFSRRKKYIDMREIYNTALDFFGKLYDVKRPMHIACSKSTIFTGAGVQNLEGVMLDESVQEKPFFVAQPSVRMNFLDEGKNGYSTSFVNICTEDANSTVPTHIRYIDQWMTWLSKIGIFGGDMTVAVRYKINDWGKGNFLNIVTDFLYGGLHVGDAGFLYDVPQKTRQNLSISDVGFGLERVSWALNKTPHYFDVFGFWEAAIRGKYDEMDSVRTIALLAGSGIDPSNKAHGYRFRALSKKISQRLNMVYPHMFEHFYRFWTSFTDLEKDRQSAYRAAQNEVARNYNLRLCKRVNFEIEDDELLASTNKLLDEMIKKGVDLQRIKEALRSDHIC